MREYEIWALVLSLAGLLLFRTLGSISKHVHKENSAIETQGEAIDYFPDSMQQIVYNTKYSTFSDGYLYQNEWLTRLNIEKYIELEHQESLLNSKYYGYPPERTKEEGFINEQRNAYTDTLSFSNSNFSISNNGENIIGLKGTIYTGYEMYIYNMPSDKYTLITNEGFMKGNGNVIDETFRNVNFSTNCWSSNDSTIVYCESQYSKSYLNSITIGQDSDTTIRIPDIKTVMKSSKYDLSNAIWLNDDDQIVFGKYVGGAEKFSKSDYNNIGLYIIDRDGSNERKLATGYFVFDIQVDRVGNIYFRTNGIKYHYKTEIFKYSTINDSLYSIAKTDGIQSFSISQDGKYIAYIKGNGNNKQLFYGSTIDSDFRHYNPQYQEFIQQCSWSPDSRYLCFTSEEPIYFSSTNETKDTYSIRLIDQTSNNVIDIIRKSDTELNHVHWK